MSLTDFFYRYLGTMSMNLKLRSIGIICSSRWSNPTEDDILFYVSISIARLSDEFELQKRLRVDIELAEQW